MHSLHVNSSSMSSSSGSSVRFAVLRSDVSLSVFVVSVFSFDGGEFAYCRSEGSI